jgi:hypothetical protein
LKLTDAEIRSLANHPVLLSERARLAGLAAKGCKKPPLTPEHLAKLSAGRRAKGWGALSEKQKVAMQIGRARKRIALAEAAMVAMADTPARDVCAGRLAAARATLAAWEERGKG